MTRCPLCSSALEEVDATTFDEVHPGYHVKGEPLPERERETRVIACSGCEFLIDLALPITPQIHALLGLR